MSYTVSIEEYFLAKGLFLSASTTDLAKMTNKNKKRQCETHKQKKLQKSFVQQKKLGKIDCRKHNFSSSTKIFASENLTPMNESIAYNCCNLKRNGLIHGCFSRDGIIKIKCEERARPVMIFHMDKLHQLFPDFFGDGDTDFDFDFGDADEDDDIFLDASQVANNSIQSSY